MRAYMTVKAGDLEFRWHGGEYIDIGSTYAMGEAGIDSDDFHAYDVINVWDYEAGAPRIPRTLDGMQQAVTAYMEDQ